MFLLSQLQDLSESGFYLVWGFEKIKESRTKSLWDRHKANNNVWAHLDLPVKYFILLLLVNPRQGRKHPTVQSLEDKTSTAPILAEQCETNRSFCTYCTMKTNNVWSAQQISIYETEVVQELHGENCFVFTWYCLNSKRLSSDVKCI